MIDVINNCIIEEVCIDKKVLAYIIPDKSVCKELLTSYEDCLKVAFNKDESCTKEKDGYKECRNDENEREKIKLKKILVEETKKIKYGITS